MEHLIVHPPKKDDGEKSKTNSSRQHHGLKSFTPPHSGIRPVSVQMKPNPIQKMQAFPENERPSYFQPNTIQRMQALPDEQKPKLMQPSRIQNMQKEKLDAMFGQKANPSTKEALVTKEKSSEKTPNENEVDPKTIKTEDVKYELIAHGLAYQNDIPLDGKKLLKKWGYKDEWKKKINDLNSGFFAGLLMPLEGSNLCPIIAFRGTEDMKDLMADADPYSVGYTSFMLNRAKIISELFSEVGSKKVDVMGHSLGGALTKYAGVEFPDKIRRVVTFQAPGINPEQSEKFNKLKIKPSVTCHIADGDIVDTAGDGHLNGEIYKHYIDKIKAVEIVKSIPCPTTPFAKAYSTGEGLLTHTSLLLSSSNYQKQHKELMPQGWDIQQMIDAVHKPEDKGKKTPAKSEQLPSYHTYYPHPYKNATAEFGRSALGRQIDPQATVINMASDQEIASLPLYASVNILKNLVTELASPTAKMAISRIIFNCRNHLGLFGEVSIPRILNSLMDQRHTTLLLQFLKQTDYYNQLNVNIQISLLKEALYCVIPRQDLVVDLLMNIPGPDARLLIIEIGKNSNFRNSLSTIYNAGLHSITYVLTGSYDDTVRKNFPFD